MKIISIWNNKGGVGKTALSFHLAQGLALMGKTTLLLDNDPQMTLSGTYCGMSSELPGMSQIYRGQEDIINCLQVQDMIQIDDEPTLIVVPGHGSFQEIFDPERTDEFKLKNLKVALSDDRLKEAFDYVIIDNNPMFFGPTKASLEVADEIFIPCIPTKSDYGGLERSFQNISSMGQEHRAKITRIIPTLVKRTAVAMINLKIMKRNFGNLVTKSQMIDAAIVPSMTEQKKIVYLSGATTNYAQAMISLIAELFPEHNIDQIRQKMNLVQKEKRIANLMKWMRNQKVSPLQIIQEEFSEAMEVE